MENTSPKIRILKADGEKEFFDQEKLVNSLKRAGAHDELIREVVSHVQSELMDDMSTTDIYRHAFMLLEKQHRPSAARYSLRRALLGFGPSGFPFEDYVGEIFKARGWSVETGKIMKGHCVEHEVDVIAWKDDRLLFAEVKFHNEPGFKTDLKIALYVKARMEDLAKVSFFIGNKERRLTDGFLITNTKFTSSAIQYGSCTRLSMMGWNYPDKENLESVIEEEKLHPLTCLTTLTSSQKQELFTKGIVLCKTIVSNPSVLSFLQLGRKEEKDVLDEAKSLFV
ncbi:MAG: ATP cone domain-containing protein [Candidatus Taylorbacteria bacterium]